MNIELIFSIFYCRGLGHAHLLLRPWLLQRRENHQSSLNVPHIVPYNRAAHARRRQDVNTAAS